MSVRVHGRLLDETDFCIKCRGNEDREKKCRNGNDNSDGNDGMLGYHGNDGNDGNDRIVGNGGDLVNGKANYSLCLVFLP